MSVLFALAKAHEDLDLSCPRLVGNLAKPSCFPSRFVSSSFPGFGLVFVVHIIQYDNLAVLCTISLILTQKSSMVKPTCARRVVGWLLLQVGSFSPGVRSNLVLTAVGIQDEPSRDAAVLFSLALCFG
jgi:hypothetical protein